MTREDFKTKSDMRIFISYFRPHIKLFLLDIGCASLISAVDLIFPFVSRKCMYDLLPEKLWQTFWTVMGIMLLAYFLRAVCQYIVGYWGHNFGIRVETDIRRDLFEHMQKLSYRFYDRERTGSLMSRLTTDLFDITEFAHHAPEDIFISTLTICGSVVIMFTMQWKLALVLTIEIPILVSIVMWCRHSMGTNSKLVKKTISVINADFESALSGMRTSKAFANEEDQFRQFSETNMKYRGAKYLFHGAMARFNSALELALCIMQLSVIAVGGALIMQGNMNVIDLITFSLYVSAFMSPVRKLAQTTEVIANGTAGLSRFLAVMRTDPEIEDAPDAVVMDGSLGSIELDHVYFRYNETDPEVLHDISFRVEPGETFALVGSSGGGKTTISQLIPRFYDVTGGSVKVDGMDVRTVTQDSLHRVVGVVQQDVFMFPATIKENIRFGRLDATDEEIEAAAKAAEIYGDIMEMPDGFDTYVGERGVRLSGGQKQRISIARIFLKNPPILILDEATSALDTVTEARIQETFDRLAKGRTSIVIAHRLSTVRNADRIAVVEKGRIVETGTHNELMSLGGEYAKLIEGQKLG